MEKFRSLDRLHSIYVDRRAFLRIIASESGLIVLTGCGRRGLDCVNNSAHPDCGGTGRTAVPSLQNRSTVEALPTVGELSDQKIISPTAVPFSVDPTIASNPEQLPTIESVTAAPNGDLIEQFESHNAAMKIEQRADGKLQWFRVPIDGIDVDIFLVKMVGGVYAVPLTAQDAVPEALPDGKRTWPHTNVESLDSFAITRSYNADLDADLGLVMTADYSAEDGVIPTYPEGCYKYIVRALSNPQRLCLMFLEENGRWLPQIRDGVIQEQLSEPRVKSAVGLGPYLVRRLPDGQLATEVYFSDSMYFPSGQHINNSLQAGRPQSMLGITFTGEDNIPVMVGMQSFGGVTAVNMANYARDMLGVELMAATDGGSQAGFVITMPDGSVHPSSRRQDPMSNAIGFYFKR